MKRTPAWKKWLKRLTYVLIGIAYLLVVYWLVQWNLSEPDSYEAKITLVSSIVIPVLVFGIRWLRQQSSTDKDKTQTGIELSNLQTARIREGLLNNVRTVWIDGFLNPTLDQTATLGLGLNYEPTAVTRKVLLAPGQEEKPIEQPLRQIFDAYGRSLLILGAPGSGKTITLLQLAEQLISEAEIDASKPIPIVLNLSSWSQQQGLLIDWLVEEIYQVYQQPRESGRTLIHQSRFLYMLDGLDEVAVEVRDDCVLAINAFKAEYPADMVVCSRIGDYQVLGERLNFGAAVRILPLDEAQINAYLSQPDLDMDAARETLQHDPEMQKLAQTPLFLSVMAVAYRGLSLQDSPPLKTTAARLHHLYNHYVQHMLGRRPLPEDCRYDKTYALTWLTHLASSMKEHNQSLFYIERLQLTWLPTERLRRHYSRLVGLIYGLIVGLLLGLIGGLMGGLIGGLMYGLIGGLVGGLIGGLMCGLIGGLIYGLIGGLSARYEPIRLAETLVWSPPPHRQLIQEIRNWLIGGLIFGLLGGLIVGLKYGLIVGLIGGLLGGLFVGLLGGLFSGLEACINIDESPRQRLRPNQGVRSSAYSALLMFGVYGLIFGLIGGLIGGLIVGLFGGLIVGLIFGLVFGLIGGPILGLISGLLKYGSGIVIKHYTLRWLLAQAGILPYPYPLFHPDRRLVAYLDAMSERILLRRVGGGWVFIHRTLLEYFAEQAEG